MKGFKANAKISSDFFSWTTKGPFHNKAYPVKTEYFWPAAMKILASRIAKELKKAKHCAVYEPDLSGVWPDDGRQREPQIASFAKTHGWRLRYYKDGFCAIFDKDPSH
jgi:hypothetical protein